MMAKAPKPKTPEVGHNLGIDPDKRALFLMDLKEWQKLDRIAKEAATKRREFEKQIKEDGFLVAQVKLGDQLATREGEDEFIAKTASLLTAAQYVGAAIGSQLSLFLRPDAAPASTAAYDAGVQDCIMGNTARSPFDPSDPQTQSYLKGFADEQERRLKSGITKLAPAKGYIPFTAEELANQQAEAEKVGVPSGARSR